MACPIPRCNSAYTQKGGHLWYDGGAERRKKELYLRHGEGEAAFWFSIKIPETKALEYECCGALLPSRNAVTTSSWFERT